jgi:hypothetical protein
MLQGLRWFGGVILTYLTAVQLFGFIDPLVIGGFLLTLVHAALIGIHEGGHIFFGLFGTFLGVAGGTLAQLLAPGSLVLTRAYAGRASMWIFVFILGISLNMISPYIGDARAEEMPLLEMNKVFNPFAPGKLIHDWNFLLGKTHLLWADQIFSCIFWAVSACVMLGAAAGLATGAEKPLALWIRRKIRRA